MNRDKWIIELAQKAYEAYCESTGWKSAITGADLPPFTDCPEKVQQGWIAVAEKMTEEIV